MTTYDWARVGTWLFILCLAFALGYIVGFAQGWLA